ncbi:MAG: hypothetical protein U0168_17470 [Nannocystaceae bacterium]
MREIRISGAASLCGLLLLAGCPGDDDATGGSSGAESSSGGSSSGGGESSSGGGSSSGGADSSSGAESSSGGSSSGGESSSGGGSSSGGSSSGGPGFCGDGELDAGEECDDANDVPGDGCENDCTNTFAAQCGMPYTTFSGADRNYTFNDGNGGVEYTDTTGSGIVSPDWAGAGWYRFTDAAGTVIPEFTPPEYACGTDAPGWLDGTHPSVDEGVVGRQVCFNYFDDFCSWTIPIQVVNCGDFYLYELPETPATALRYCGSDLMTADPQCSAAYGTFDSSTRNTSFNDGNGGVEYTDTTGSMIVSPDWAGPGWYRFTSASGHYMPEFAPGPYSCGTDAPGWFDGARPAVADGVVDGTVCFEWNGDACYWSTPTSVVNCGAYYLYELPETPATALRYCGTDVDPDPQCSQPYAVLDEADRNVSFNDGNGGIEYGDQSGDAAQSPNWLGDGWYRFDGSAGTQMPETAPAAFACGTDAPGWLSGAHPQVADGVVDRQACFSWSGNTCNWSTDIQVVDCGEFYLYHLVDTQATVLRYCGE